LRNGGVANVADLAMLLAIRLRVPVAGCIRAQPDHRQDERDREETYRYSFAHLYDHRLLE